MVDGISRQHCRNCMIMGPSLLRVHLRFYNGVSIQYSMDNEPLGKAGTTSLNILERKMDRWAEGLNDKRQKIKKLIS